MDGWRTQLTRQIGEHLVATELARKGYAASPFAGNVPLFDLLAADREGYIVPIQVKAINGPSWQFSGSNFLDIEPGETAQVVRGLLRPPNPNLVFVLVFVRDTGTDEFYVLRFGDLQGLIYAHYTPRALPKNVKSFHCALWPRHVDEYRNRWEILTDAFALTRQAPAPFSN